MERGSILIKLDNYGNEVHCSIPVELIVEWSGGWGGGGYGLAPVHAGSKAAGKEPSVNQCMCARVSVRLFEYLVLCVCEGVGGGGGGGGGLP